MALADVPLKTFLHDVLIDYDQDKVTRLIIDEHCANLFAAISHFTVGDFRNWLLNADAMTEKLQKLALSLTPEMVAAVNRSCVIKI